MTRNLLIPADPMVDLIYMDTRIDPTQLSARLRGYYETIPLPDAVGWVNEEGKFRDFPPNERATRIAQHALFTHDWIAGDMIITGGADPNGDVTDLVAEWITANIESLGLKVTVAPSILRSQPPITRPE